jgi:hypothetical protein
VEAAAVAASTVGELSAPGSPAARG